MTKRTREMKSTYETPIITVCLFDTADVITTSDWDIELPKQEFSW